MVRWALREEFAILAMVVAVICCRSFCIFFVNFWSLEESRYVPESSCFACFDVVVGIAHAIFAVSRCSKMFFLNKSTVRPISPRVFVGFLIVERPWKALSKQGSLDDTPLIVVEVFGVRSRNLESVGCGNFIVAVIIEVVLTVMFLNSWFLVKSL
jgi:hypothetical protein